MPGKGYKVLSVKEEVVKKIQDRAKKEEVSISKLLDKLLEKGSTDAVKTSSNDTVIETIRTTIREVLNEKEEGNITTTDINAGITKEDLKNALLGLENDIDLKISDMISELKRGGL